MTSVKRTTRKKPPVEVYTENQPVDVQVPPEPTLPPQECGNWRISLRFGTSSMILFNSVSKPFALGTYRMLAAAMMDGLSFEYVGEDTGLNLIDGRKIAAVHMHYIEPPRKRARADDPCCGDEAGCDACDCSHVDMASECHATDKAPL